AGRDQPGQADRVEHLVVVAEVVARDQVQPGVGLRFPGRLPDRAGDPRQLILTNFAGPEALDGSLQLAMFADTGVTENRTLGHGLLLVTGAVSGLNGSILTFPYCCTSSPSRGRSPRGTKKRADVDPSE